MVIPPYLLSRLSRWEIFQLTADVLTYANKFEEVTPETFNNKLTELQTAFEIYDEELVQERRPTPELLLEMDEARSYAIRKLHDVIRVYGDYKFVEEKEVASKNLRRITKKYGSGRSISRLGQDSKTAVITNLLQDLAQDDAKQHIATLDLTDVVASLIVANETFENEQLLRKKYLSEFVKDVVKNARTDVQARFIEFVDVVNALAVVEGPEKYADLKQKISTYVKHYVAQAKLRRKKKVVEA